MSKFPSLPLFTDAFIADTGHLSAAETGAYLLLLMMAWRSPGCRLPDDDAKLARWARVDPRAWRRMKPTVMDFWVLAEGFWTQKRLLSEHEKVCKHAESARQNGKHGGRPKSLKHNGRDNPAGSSWATQRKAPNPNPKDKREYTNARATAFPDDFEPNETDKRVAAEVGCPDLLAEIDHFRDHHVSKGNVFKDWHAALRTWLRSPLRGQRLARPPPVNGHRSAETLPFPARQDRQHVPSTRGSSAQFLRAELEAELAELRTRESEDVFAQHFRIISQ
jgi:uncharacterized protein YdaU (DUF1376 family)